MNIPVNNPKSPGTSSSINAKSNLLESTEILQTQHTNMNKNSFVRFGGGADLGSWVSNDQNDSNNASKKD
jgi:hypothetical protein